MAPGLREYKGASNRPPEITRQIQYMSLEWTNKTLSTGSSLPYFHVKKLHIQFNRKNTLRAFEHKKKDIVYTW